MLTVECWYCFKPLETHHIKVEIRKEKGTDTVRLCSFECLYHHVNEVWEDRRKPYKKCNKEVK